MQNVISNVQDIDDLTLHDFTIAHDIIKDNVHKTYMGTASSTGRDLGVKLYFKCENLQRTGSFKIRGALHKLIKINGESKSNGVIAVSAGNHGQATALAARTVGKYCKIVMPESAVKAKVAACRDYGAEVELFGSIKDAFQLAQKDAIRKNLIFIHPFDDVDIILGQGSVSLEIFDQLDKVDCIVVGIGGGGLISGVAAVAKAINPDVRVYGVEPEGARSMYNSIIEGMPVAIDEVNTIADGLGSPMAGEITFRYVRKFVDEVVLVSDDEIARAMNLLLLRHKLLTEPAGAAPLAAIIHNKIPLNQGENVVAILSGGNVDLNTIEKLVLKKEFE